MDDAQLFHGDDGGDLPCLLHRFLSPGLAVTGELSNITLGKRNWKYADCRVDHLPPIKTLFKILRYLTS